MIVVALHATPVRRSCNVRTTPMRYPKNINATSTCKTDTSLQLPEIINWKLFEYRN